MLNRRQAEQAARYGKWLAENRDKEAHLRDPYDASNEYKAADVVRTNQIVKDAARFYGRNFD